MTAEVVIQKLRSIGYQIRTDGQDILLTSDRDPPDPELATRLLTELKKYKAEAVNILKGSTALTEKPQPEANMRAFWPLDDQSLIDWFSTLEPPTEPFYLESHRHIVAPSKFFASLQRDIQTGPRGPRARMGTLQWDLWKLKAYLN